MNRTWSRRGMRPHAGCAPLSLLSNHRHAGMRVWGNKSCGERHDASNDILFHQALADLPLAHPSALGRAIRQEDHSPPPDGQLTDDVLDPREVRLARGRRAVDPPGVVVPELVVPPIGHIEWRVGQHQVAA